MVEIRKIQEQVIGQAISKFSNSKVARDIVFGQNNLAQIEDNATWVKAIMSRLESNFNPSQIKQIRMNCQCGYGMEEKIDLVKKLVADSSNLAELANLEQAKAAGLFYSEDELYLQFRDCPCPMLTDVDRLETDSWCQCTTGYSKCLFEQAFQCKVDVKLLKSIKMGDQICLMKIIPLGMIWK